MKNIFGLNKSVSGGEVFDGAAFITASVAEECTAEVEENKKFAPALPLPLSILQYVFVAMFAIALGIWVSSGKTFELMLQSSVYVPILMAAGFVGFVVIAIIDIAISKKFAKENGLEKVSDVEEFVEIHEVDEEAEAAAAAKVKSELGIPEDAADMDFLSFFYREGADGIFPIKPFDFMTLEMFAYKDGDLLCVADYNDVYSIPISAFTSIEKIERSVTVLGWSKDEGFDSEVYAEYGMTETAEGFISLPYYYSARIAIENEDGEAEEFELLIPPYEYKAFSDLCGLNA